MTPSPTQPGPNRLRKTVHSVSGVFKTCPVRENPGSVSQNGIEPTGAATVTSTG